jgi:hypothetical protein
MIKASAMTYAILLILFTAVFSFAIVMIASGSKWLTTTQHNKEQVIANLFSTLNYALTQTIELAEETTVQINGDTCSFIAHPWGMYDVITVKSHKNKFTLSKSFLVGNRSLSNHTALYLADTDQPLKVTGETKLKGLIHLPKRGIERAYIEGKNYKGEKLYYGEKAQSEKYLPVLKEQFLDLDVRDFYKKYDYILMHELPTDSVFIFGGSTNVFHSVNPIYLNDVNLTGNLVIHSDDSITVRSNSTLNQLILIAPIVRVEKDFTGSIQIYATERIEIEEGVLLNFPSSLFLQDRDDAFRREFESAIHIHENAKINGGVLITSTSPDFRNPVKLDIKEKAIVAGIIYNQGETQLRGSIWGSIFTKRFYLKTKSSSYVNHLMDATIDRTVLPDFFVIPDWLKKDEFNSRIVLMGL